MDISVRPLPGRMWVLKRSTVWLMPPMRLTWKKWEKTAISQKSMPTMSLNLTIPDGAESMKMSRCAMS